MKCDVWHRILVGTAQSVLAALAATLVAAIITAALGRSPVAVLTSLATAPFSDGYRFAEALARSCPLMLCGLAVAIAFRAQAWNIGVEGQYLAGAIAATAVGLSSAALPGYALIPAMMAGAGLAGALIAVPAALLETLRGVPIVLSTILINFVARGFVEYLTQGPLRGSDPSAAQSDPIPSDAWLPVLVPQTDLHWGFVAAVVICLLAWLMLRSSTAGFAMRIAGANPTAAEWTGIRVARVKVGVMAISGALGGLAGGIQIAGVQRLLNIQASEGFGYVGIAVALLGRLHPIGVILAAISLGLLDIGAAHVERQPALAIPADLANVIKGFVILAVLVLGGERIGRRTRGLFRRSGARAPVPLSAAVEGRTP